MSSSDGGPSPLPSPIFARCSPARGTVAKKCREFYLRRLERTATMQKRWSICCDPLQDDPPEDPPQEEVEQEVVVEESGEGYPLRKCRSSFDIAMDSLRKEISSLIAQDNDLFRQLLSLHDSIAELRERQRHSAYLDDDDDDEDEEVEDDECRHRLLSLDSLESPETSPESTLSSRSSSLSSDYHHHKSRHYHKSRDHKSRDHHKSPSKKSDGSRPLVFIDKSEICFRCRKMAPPYRRSSSITSLYYLHEDLESYDSGIHLHGSHSDSDHEIFV